MINHSLRTLFFWLVAIVVFLLFMHIFPNDIILLVDKRFNLNEEANIPTWYSTVLLFSVSVSSFINHFLEKKETNTTESGSLFWLVFGVAYCFLSIDEAGRIHEFINYLTSTKWVFIYAPFVAIFFVICAHYFFVIRKDDKTVRNWIIGGLSLYITGGLVLEFISFMLPLPPFMVLAEILLEEGFEMTGTIMVLIGSLHQTGCLFTRQYSSVSTEQ